MVETGSHVTHQEFVTTLTTMESVPTETVVSRTSAAFVLAPILPQSARNNFNVDFSPLPSGIISPVNVNLLQHVLSTHPHRRLVDYVLNGFRFGFDIGFVGDISSSRPRNLLSARQNPTPVFAAICKELSRGHTSGPFRCPPF